MNACQTIRVLCFACVPALLPCWAIAQTPDPPAVAETAVETAPELQPAAPSAGAYSPITSGERVEWVVSGVVGPRSLGIGVIAGLWDTAINSPEEWQRSWSGFGKRYLEREADVAISSAIEAGVGALWGEEPRYIPSQRRGAWPRAQYAMKTVFLAQRRNGQLAPAWGRIAGNVFNNVIENSWLPPSATTGSATTWRAIDGFAGRLIGNLWEEFWPEIKKRAPWMPR